MRKSQFLLRLQNDREAWEHLINHVGSARLGIGGISGAWSVRDIVAHVMAREQHLADRLHDILHYEPPIVCKTQDELDTFLDDFGYPDFDSPLLTEEASNEWIVQKYHNIPFKDLVTLEVHAYDATLECVKALSEEQLSALDLYSRIEHVTGEHYRHHAADIRKRFKAPLKR